jgi:hypothetical protein
MPLLEGGNYDGSPRMRRPAVSPRPSVQLDSFDELVDINHAPSRLDDNDHTPSRPPSRRSAGSRPVTPIRWIPQSGGQYQNMVLLININ